MRRAHIYVPNQAAEMVADGLGKLGYKIRYRSKAFDIDDGDVVVMWTLYQNSVRKKIADRLAGKNVSVVCIEGGWLRGLGMYQLALRDGINSGFNGYGKYTAGDGSRWASFGVELKPWRDNGSHILLFGNKGSKYQEKITPDICHSDTWLDNIIARIRKHTPRPIHYRPHPKVNGDYVVPRVNMPDKIIDSKNETIEESLRDAWCSVVYASSSASQSIVNGVPVIYDASRIMLHELAAGKITMIEKPPRPDRIPVLERCAWAQWSAKEIESGLPFKRLGL